MLIVIPACRKDEALVLKNLAWAFDLDGQQESHALLAMEKGSDQEALVKAAMKAFLSVDTFIYDAWTGSQAWPHPQNYAWQTVARHVYGFKEPWYWWESDVTPLRAGWFQDLKNIYDTCGKPFMGAVVEGIVPTGHMNGAGFYPYDIRSLGPGLMAYNDPFDVAMGQATRTQRHDAGHLMGHKVKQHQQSYSFQDQEALDQLMNEFPVAVVFHGCADGTLIDRLRERGKNGRRKESKPTQPISVWPSIVNWITRKKWPAIYHCVERHRAPSEDDQRRMTAASETWLRAYQTKYVRPAHLWEGDYPRDARSIGDSRNLPYLKDVLAVGITACRFPDDIVMLTNDDTIFGHDLPKVVMDYMLSRNAVSSFRLNFKPGTQPVAPNCTSDIGRDLFAFRRSWIQSVWEKIPDFILGESPWDLVLAALLRMSCDPPIAYNRENATVVFEACEIPRGHVFHEIHVRRWMNASFAKSPAKLHNNRLANEFAEKHRIPDLIQK